VNMENHGFGRKTFQIETDIQGKAIVHHLKGKFTEAHYQEHSWIWDEVNEHFDLSKNIYLVVIEISTTLNYEACGLGASAGLEGGMAILPASGICFNSAVAAHELGHTFGLQHDQLSDANRIPALDIADGMTTSFCAAQWLDVHRHFNVSQVYPKVDKPTTIQMLPPLVDPPYGIRLRFEVLDPDGLHQAQMSNNAWETIAYSGLKGQNSIVEFVTTQLAITSDTIYKVPFRVIDVYGHITEKIFSIDLRPLLSDKVVSIPDTNLAAVIRETTGLAPTDPIRQRDMLKLTELNASDLQITDLTGIEHAINLKNLQLTDNQIHDVSPLSALTNLSVINLTNNAISDISALAGLRDQTLLYLSGNPVFGSPGPKIEGPWLWMIAPTGRGGEQAAVSGVDFLAQASGGSVTEQDIATKGATPGEAVGGKVWTLGRLAPIGDNITEVVNAAGLGQGNIDNHVAYGSIVLDSPQRQETTMYVGSDDAVKVWLNGVLVHSNPVDRGANDYQDFFPVVLKQGTNILLVAIYEHSGGWSGFFGFKNDTVYNLSTNTDASADESVDVLIYTGNVWWISRSEAMIEAKTTKILLQSVGIHVEITNNENNVKQWMLQTTSDGSVDVLILYGPIPTTIYPPGNTMPNRSVAENWIETPDGNTILNHADSFGFWSTGNINLDGQVGEWNGGGTLQNLMDIPNIFIPIDRDNISMFVTTDGNALTPSLVNFQSDRAFPLDQLQGDWFAEKILASNTGNAHGTLADPVILRDGNLGRITIVHQTSFEDNPKGEVAAEIISNYLFADTTESSKLNEDVNNDGIVNIQDLVLVASSLGQTGTNVADVDENGVVDIRDLVKAASALGSTAAAPILHQQPLETLTAADVQKWLFQAQSLDLADTKTQRGIRFLEQLLAALMPKETVLLPNYPNPFNPETWIPYQLAEPAHVMITIYAINGKAVQRLELGYQAAGIYQSRRHAAYWDGRNEQGEHVASGIYFYTLTAGYFSATRKLLIRK
ncbi:T9SS type A sorting domain-containing protein, partial [Candidatus Poribacteria bacterium]|nr:T9SS type A sorting domain-containing protein [Candidatus Poribacteria bacterium]